jgi:hypothetical protein
VTEEGKARSAQNARSYGFRSSSVGLFDLDDEERFRQLEAGIQERYQPTCPVEAAICARMTLALWRAERADALEAEYWCLLPYGASSGTPLRRARVLHAEEANRRHGLQTILRYQAEAMNAFTRAVRALTLLRKEKAEPAPEPANENQPAELPSACTNEPEPAEPEPAPAGAEPPAEGPPAAAKPEAPASLGWSAAEFHAWSERCRARIEQFVAGPELPDDTDEPGLSQPSHRRSVPPSR